MAYREPTGQRKPMSDEAKARIAEAVRKAAEKKRQEMGLLSGSSTPAAPDFLERPLELVKMRDQNFSPSLFIPMRTEKPIDLLFTEESGVPKACNYMLVGDPGVGKTTVSLDIVSDLKLAGYKVLVVQAEMTRIDLYKYVERYPKFGDLDILFTGEYCESNPKTVLEQALKPGYDIVLLDSFVEIQNDVKEALRVSGNGAEKWLIDLMKFHNLGNNDNGTHTTFLAIQQVTKGGVFVGSNRIKHNTSGMMEMRFGLDPREAYMMFSKNRRGPANRRLYYSLSSTGDVNYDLVRYHADETIADSVLAEAGVDL